MEPPNISSQAIELNTSCSGQAHPNSPATGSGYENTEPGCNFAVIRSDRENNNHIKQQIY